jgi:hypothetical protein
MGSLRGLDLFSSKDSSLQDVAFSIGHRPDARASFQRRVQSDLDRGATFSGPADGQPPARGRGEVSEGLISYPVKTHPGWVGGLGWGPDKAGFPRPNRAAIRPARSPPS